MVTFTYKISDPNGLHARSAAYLAQFVTGRKDRIRVRCKGRAADGRQMMELMKLRAKCGDMLEFEVEGASEEDTAAELKRVAGELL